MIYKSLKKETPRIFESPFLELLSKVHWTCPIIIYVPIITFLIYLSMQRNPLGTCILLGVSGLFAWILFEYLVHRFVFHYQPRSTWGKRMHYIIHGIHHDYPNDPYRLVMPPAVSLPVTFLFGGLFYVTLGNPTFPPFFAGCLLGYLFYDISHYWFHHNAFKHGLLKKLQKHHLQHHFKDPQSRFGVSTMIGDIIFKTKQ